MTHKKRPGNLIKEGSINEKSEKEKNGDNDRFKEYGIIVLRQARHDEIEKSVGDQDPGN